MINTVLLDNKNDIFGRLTKVIQDCRISMDIKAIASTIEEAHQILKKTRFDLTIIDIDAFAFKDIQSVLNGEKQQAEIIYISKSRIQAIEALSGHAAEYLIRPIQKDLMVKAVEEVEKRLKMKAEVKKKTRLLENILIEKKTTQSIGIPTIDGFSFFKIGDIVRCEGLQKCTRIITTTKTDVISSYNIGEFRKILEPYGFFTTHKSHLINLSFVKHYKREGSIILNDNSRIPVSKRRKSAFLEQVLHP